MSVRVVGNPGMMHVSQPKDSEQCFAAIVASVSNTDISTADSAITAANLYDNAGLVGHFMKTQHLDIGINGMTIDPIVKPLDEAAEDSEEVLSAIMASLSEEKAVGLLHRRKPDLETYHWLLIRASVVDLATGKPMTFDVSDPLKQFHSVMRGEKLRRKIDDSIKYLGVSAVTLS